MFGFMKTLNSLKVSGVVVVGFILLMTTCAQAAIVAYNFPSTLAGNETSDGAVVVGNQFQVNSPISVTAVGAFNDVNNGNTFNGTIQVAIYDLSTGLQVPFTSASFSGTSPGTQVGTAWFQDLGSPVTLNPGTYAIVGANYGNPAEPLWWVGNPHTDTVTFQSASAAISMDAPTGGVELGSTLPATYSPLVFKTDPTPSYAGATFEFTAVPEVANYGAVSAGLLGLVCIVRHMGLRRRSEAA
jgi:hypothetical protein